jgi:hypothetical protein
MGIKGTKGTSRLGPLGPLEPYQDSNYIAFVMIALDHHAQLNRSICYILVYTSTCAFPILLGYSLWLYYLALHYLLTRGCDYLIGRCRDTPQFSKPNYDPGNDNGILGSEKNYNEDYEADSEEPDTVTVPGNNFIILTRIFPYHTDRPIGPELSISLSFSGLAAEIEFENLTDDLLPAIRHGSKNIIDNKDKISDADEKASIADSDYSYDNKASTFTFTAENKSFNDCNYELASKETAVDPLLRLTRSAVIIYISRNVFRQLTVEKILKSEESTV